jgi:8-amino-7-oxononanoate synthase
MNDPLGWLDDEAAARDRAALARTLRTYGPAVPGRLRSGSRTLVNFASNDYLGLAADPRVIAAAREAAEEYGWGAGASPLVCGWRTIHEELAAGIAAFERTEAALLFPTGFAANLGTIAALVGTGDAVYGDRLNHACLVAGARLAGASLRVYPHYDPDRLESILARERSRFRRVLIATDGVFSMDGDLAPLAELVAIAERFEAMLMVDEAHGTGVFGPDGRGAASECGVADRVPIRVGTLSKALGSLGGFVAGSRRLIAHLLNRAPSLVYSTSLPPAAAAAAREALGIAQAEPWRRERARRLGDRVRSGLVPAESPSGNPDRVAGASQAPPQPAMTPSLSSTSGPIIPVLIGEPARTLALSDCLRERGFLVPAIRPPTVPKGTSRLRVSVSAAHTDEEVAALIQAMR